MSSAADGAEYLTDDRCPALRFLMQNATPISSRVSIPDDIAHAVEFHRHIGALRHGQQQLISGRTT